MINKNVATLVTVLALLAVPAFGASYYLAPDVPANLGGTDYEPAQIVRSDSASYSLINTLPAGVEVNALFIENNGDYVFSMNAHVNLGGTDYEARDVVGYNGASYSMILDGSGSGIPAYADIDSVYRTGAGVLVIGFDVPTNLGGTEYMPSDMANWLGGSSYTKAFDSVAQSIPLWANAVGADSTSAGTVFSFDVPVNLGGTEYIPGDLVLFNGAVFSLYDQDGSWPAYAVANAFCFLPTPGGVPDGNAIPGVQLSVTKNAANLDLAWGVACSSGGEDYSIYEGSLSSFTSHGSAVCSTSGLTSDTISPSAGSRYYLVVPNNTDSEGSYGYDSAATPRPAASSPCRSTQDVGSCS